LASNLNGDRASGPLRVAARTAVSAARIVTMLMPDPQILRQRHQRPAEPEHQRATTTSLRMIVRLSP
jgi:hypothetical protein